MGHDAAQRWTADEFLRLPEDTRRVELLDGEIVVTTPLVHHQRVVMRLGAAFVSYLSTRGGEVFNVNVDIRIDDLNVVQPDVQLFLPEHLDRIGSKRVEGPPDLAVEVSSPSMKGVDRIRKRSLYERFGVAEFWIVDLDDDVIEAYRLVDGAYAAPERFGRGDTVRTPLLPGWAVEFDQLLPPQD